MLILLHQLVGSELQRRLHSYHRNPHHNPAASSVRRFVHCTTRQPPPQTREWQPLFVCWLFDAIATRSYLWQTFLQVFRKLCISSLHFCLLNSLIFVHSLAAASFSCNFFFFCCTTWPSRRWQLVIFSRGASMNFDCSMHCECRMANLWLFVCLTCFASHFLVFKLLAFHLLFTLHIIWLISTLLHYSAYKSSNFAEFHFKGPVAWHFGTHIHTLTHNILCCYPHKGLLILYFICVCVRLPVSELKCFFYLALLACSLR